MTEQWLHYGDQRIPYRVLLVPERHGKVAIHVNPNGSVRVEAPRETSLTAVKQAVLRRARWVSRHVQRAQFRNSHVLPREYVSGESHFYLGRRHVLKVRRNIRAEPSVKLRNGRFEVVVASTEPDAVRNLLQAWYWRHAEEQFGQRLETLVQSLKWLRDPPQWKLLPMKKQWGSCSPKGVLSLNPHLVKAPPICIDYVLLHELCHLKVHRHNQAFYRLLGQEMPDWELVKARLDGKAGLLLTI